MDVYFPEYKHVGLSGYTYSPIFKDGKWYLYGKMQPLTLLEIAFLCKIPDEELTALKLKYGG